MSSDFTRKLVHAFCIIVMLKCAEQTKKRTLKEFRCILDQNITTSWDAERLMTGSAIIHRGVEDIGIEDFVQLCSELKGTREEDEVSIISVRTCYKGTDDNSENLLANVMMSMHKHLKNPDKKVVFVKNLETAFYTIEKQYIHDFDFGDKYHRDTEKVLQKLHLIIHESIIRHTYEQTKVALFQTLTQKLFNDADVQSMCQDTTDESALPDLNEFCDSFMSAILDDVFKKTLREAQLKIMHLNPTKGDFYTSIINKINKYQKENGIRVFKANDEKIMKIIHYKLKDDVTLHFDDCIAHLQSDILEVLRKKSIERSTFVDAYQKLFANHANDYQAWYNCLRNGSGDRVTETMLYTFPEYMKRIRLDDYGKILDEYLVKLNFDNLLCVLASEMIAKKINHIKNSFYCNEKTQIFYRGDLTDDKMAIICNLLKQTKALENDSTNRAICIDEHCTLSLLALQKFDKKYTKRIIGAEKTSDQQVHHVPEIFEVFYCEENTEEKETLSRYTMGDYIDRCDNPLERMDTGDNNCSIERARSLDDLLTQVDFFNRWTLNDLRDMPESILIACIDRIWSDIVLPIDICRILIADKEIILLSSKDGIRTSMLYNIPDLYLISEDDQLYTPEELGSNILYLENLPGTFLENLNGFLRISFLLGKLCDIKNTYSTAASFYKEIGISYHVPLDKVKSEGINGTYGKIIDCLYKIEEILNTKVRYIDLILQNFRSQRVIDDRDFAHSMPEKSSISGMKDICDCASFVVENRHIEGLTYHLAFEQDNLLRIGVRTFAVKRNQQHIATFAIRRDFKENLNSSVASLPLVTLTIILNNPNNDYQKFLTHFGFGKDSLRLETLVICWIGKHHTANYCNWDVDERYYERLDAREKVINMCKELVKRATSIDYIGVSEKSALFAKRCEIAKRDKFNIDDYISNTVDFVIDAINKAMQEKTIKITAIYNQKPTKTDIEFVENFKNEILAAVEKNEKEMEK